MIASQKQLTDTLVSHLTSETAAAAPAPQAEVPTRNALFAVHGISPTQRYAFQDQVALALQCYLNAQEQLAGSGFTWSAIVHWPRVGKGDDSPAVRPSALRIYRSDEKDPENPTGTIYDVYEGYWSPFSKGRTNIRSALQWLFSALFLGSSSTANVPSTREKLKSDLIYVGVLLLGVALALTIAVLFALGAWLMLMQTLPNRGGGVGFWDIISNPLSSAAKLPVLAYVEFAVDGLAAFVLAELIVVYRAAYKRRQRADELQRDATGKRFQAQTINARTFHGFMLYVLWAALFVLIAIAVLFGWFYGHLQGVTMALFPVYAALVVMGVAFLRAARGLADFAVESVLGDIQIYTTHDNNSTYFTIRQQIIDAVVQSLTGVLCAVVDPDATPQQPYYQRIHIFGHSLGSTIAMDTLIRLRQMLQEGSLAAQQWTRIRSFTTFGTALEKTRFFFDVRQPTISAAADQWENDVYGRFFTDNAATLQNADNSSGIYWSNLWYFRDVVANEIVSYASDVQVAPAHPGFSWSSATTERTICQNYLLPHERPRFAWVHSDYLADAAFWQNVGPVVTAR